MNEKCNLRKEIINLTVYLLFIIILSTNVQASTLQTGQNQSEEKFQNSFYCAECHEDRYKEWSNTMHALAITDPIYRSAYMKAVLSDPSNREYCLKCHSPLTKITNDFSLSKSISVEGVSCSFCHSVKDIDIANNNYELNQDGILVGPYRDSFSEEHPSNYSELLTKSEFCAGCHEFSLNGVPISETYSEWKEGPYSKEGKQCQDCHMQAFPGYSSNNIKREKVYRHYWYGGHTGQFLEKAFNIEYQIKKEGKKANVTLNITNENVGHKIPSGFPSRQVILHLSVTDNKNREIFKDQRIFTKTLLDEFGNEVYDFWKAKSIGKDNRIKPKESRMETFEFDLPEDINNIEVHTTLKYHLEAEVITTSLENIDVELINKKDTIDLADMAIKESTPKKLLSKELSPEEVLTKEVSKKTPSFEMIEFVISIIIVAIITKKSKINKR